jgi:cytochrome c553
MRKRLVSVAVLSVAAWLAGSATATASLDMQKQAKAAGVQVANCLHCHGEKLPKKDASTYNERGKWLIAEKEKRKADKVDGAWLKDYAEKK